MTILGTEAVAAQLPDQLYRYVGVRGERLEWLRQLLVDSRMYCPSADEFNDPHDCRVPPRFHGSELEVAQYWRQVAGDAFAIPHQRRQHVKKMVAKTRTMQGRASIEATVAESLRVNGVLCFAESPINTLLWAYYAEGHSGVAIRFNTSDAMLRQFRWGALPVKVRYQSEFPDVNYYKASNTELLSVLFGTKSAAWRHEEEWRLVIPNKVGLMTVPSAFVDAVILGLRTPPAVVEQVREWVALRRTSTELLEVVNKDHSFELMVRPVPR